jgi:hypothetical protein
VTKDEVARKLTKVNQLMDELIYAFMQTGMSYRQEEEDVFRMLRERDCPKKPKTTEDWLTHTLLPLEWMVPATAFSLEPFSRSPASRAGVPGRTPSPRR